MHRSARAARWEELRQRGRGWLRLRNDASSLAPTSSTAAEEDDEVGLLSSMMRSAHLPCATAEEEQRRGGGVRHQQRLRSGGGGGGWQEEESSRPWRINDAISYLLHTTTITGYDVAGRCALLQQEQL